MISLIACSSILLLRAQATTKYKYEDFSAEDIWHQNLTEKQGCVRLNSSFYLEHIYDQPESSWFISIVSPITKRQDNHYSTTMMQTLFFLKRERPDINCGFILRDDEELREVFENQGLPQALYITEGNTYYMDNTQLGIEQVLEFLQRYKQLAVQGAYKELTPPFEGYLIYFEYWKKHAGLWAKRLYKETTRFIKRSDPNHDLRMFYDPALEWYRNTFVTSLTKTAGKRFIIKILLPLFASGVCLVYLSTKLVLRMCLGGCRKSKVE